MNTIYIEYFKTPYGELIMGSFDGQLCLCDWRYRKMRASVDKRMTTQLKAEYVEKETEVVASTKQQLTEYYDQKRTNFDIPILKVGTVFQQSVWDELIKIPFGETESYLGLSRRLGNEKAIRAVASANGANAISILIPCHRIIGSNGELTGYAGGLPTKKKLLSLEGVQFPREQLSLFPK